MISTAQIEAFQREGYVAIPDVVPPDLCQRVIDVIAEYCAPELTGSEAGFPESRRGHGIVPVHHHQALWDVRQHPAVHQLFAALYGTSSLWVSMDRISFKPPNSPTDWKPLPLHWDGDPWRYPPLSIQGVVYLTDTRPDQGAFCCAPSIYSHLDDYRKAHEADDNRIRPQVEAGDVVGVGGRAGTLVAFNRMLPHSSLINHSDQPRFVQYVAMQPVGKEKLRRQRIREWQEKLPPEWAIRQQIPNQQIPEPGESANLSALGRKLVGLDPW